MFFPFSYSTPKLFFNTGCWYVFVLSQPICWLDFFSLFWNVLFCLLFNHFPSPFEFSYFRQYLFIHLFISIVLSDLFADVFLGSFCLLLVVVLTPGVTSHFNWNLSDSKSSQLSRTLLSILADLSRVLVRTFSGLSLFFSSSVFFPVSSGQLKMFQRWLVSSSTSCSIKIVSLARFRYLSNFLFFFFIRQSVETTKSVDKFFFGY